MVNFKKIANWFAPKADKEQDGRDKWPSRTAFVLAAMVSFPLPPMSAAELTIHG